MLPISGMLAAELSPKNRRKIRLKTSSGSINVRHRKLPMVSEVKHEASNQDSVFTELESLRDGSASDLLREHEIDLIQPDFSVFDFWMQEAAVECVIENLDGIDFQSVPDIDGDSFWNMQEFDSLDWESASEERRFKEDAVNEQLDLKNDNELLEFKKDTENDHYSGDDRDPVNFCDVSAMEFLQDPTILLISPPVKEMDARLLSVDTEPSTFNGNSFPASSVSPISLDNKGNSQPTVKPRRLTSTRSKKKKRLNPAIAQGSLRFFSETKAETSRDEVSEELKCNEVLTDFDSDGTDVEYFRTVHKEAKLSRLNKVSIKKAKPRRSNLLPVGAVEVLSHWLDEHISNPYATREEKDELSKRCGLKYEQVDNWLSNTRYKLNLQRSRRNTGLDGGDSPVAPRMTQKKRSKKRRIYDRI